ncbi:thiamine biosynthesis protein ThiS [marine bacterium AO1-C]|nr:thiamine biosynthesis protein ThiS [marine bacterium AO1-C]
MEIQINQNTYSLEASKTIHEVLEQLDLPRHKGVAIAVNNAVVPQTEWDKYALQDADKVLLIKASAGG